MRCFTWGVVVVVVMSLGFYLYSLLCNMGLTYAFKLVELYRLQQKWYTCHPTQQILQYFSGGRPSVSSIYDLAHKRVIVCWDGLNFCSHNSSAAIICKQHAELYI
jgi:hypothetical protein